jgi:hypothetical protein
MNSTIVPFDIAMDTPYYNEELYRLYADHTFRNSINGLIGNKNANFQPQRFSNQYKSLIRQAGSKIEQNHPEIEKQIRPLIVSADKARKELNKKISGFEDQWRMVATARGLDLTSKDPTAINEIYLQHVTWLNAMRYREAIGIYTDQIDSLNAQIDTIRRSVYSLSEQAILSNLNNLTESYYLPRPWNASTERSSKAAGFPLTDAYFADPRHVPGNLYDISLQILPVGDLTSFLTASGIRSFASTDSISTTTISDSRWGGGGGGGVSFFGLTIGGGAGASGSSSYRHAVSTLNEFKVGFGNVSEYFADRTAWFDPAVLQDSKFQKMVKGRPEFDNLNYICVSLILARGLNLELKFSEAVNKTDWSNSAVDAQGGISFLGYRFGGQGTSSGSTTTIKVDTSGTVVTFTDGPTVCRVLGARVEQILNENAPQTSKLRQVDNLKLLMDKDAHFQAVVKDFAAGKKSYVELQGARIEALKK